MPTGAERRLQLWAEYNVSGNQSHRLTIWGGEVLGLCLFPMIGVISEHQRHHPGVGDHSGTESTSCSSYVHVLSGDVGFARNDVLMNGFQSVNYQDDKCAEHFRMDPSLRLDI
jgi:hypothetical protein